MGYKVKAPELMPDINVVPMADIMLVMLIIFMVITPMLQKGFSVEMAKTDNPRDMKEADKDDAVDTCRAVYGPDVVITHRRVAA